MYYLDTCDGIFPSPADNEAKRLRILAEQKDAAADCARRIASLSFTEFAYEFEELRDPPPGFMAFDSETFDPTLTDIGSASAFAGEGETLGFAVAWNGFEAYWPYGHTEGNAGPRDKYMAWLRHQARRPDIIFVCANAAYDMGWMLREIGFLPVGGVIDVQHMAALLDEVRPSYSLDNLGRIYLKRGKDKGAIEFVTAMYGKRIIGADEHDLFGKKEAPKKEAPNLGKRLGKTSLVMRCLKHIPGWALGRYAAQDARLTYDLADAMLPQITAEGLQTVFRLESELIPLSVHMRMRGMRVNTARAEQAADELAKVHMPALQAEIRRISGVAVEPWQSETIERALQTIGINYGRTEKTEAARIDARRLERDAARHPLCAHLLRLRKMAKVENTFLRGHILAHARDGRVHAEINQLRAERDSGAAYGTVTGRYSVTNPGLQQIPVRDPEFGPLVRSMFEAEDGEEICSVDYSSQEPRLAVHFAYKARIPRAIEAVEAFHKNPRLDYHQFVADICGISRAKAKTLNLGLAYGMGGAKLAHSLGLPTQWFHVEDGIWKAITPGEAEHWPGSRSKIREVAGDEAKAIIRQWEEGAPFIRGLFKMCSDKAAERGYIQTLLKRRCRFPLEGGQRQWTHKAMNRLCQSSAADQLKLGLLSLWKDGLIPLIPIHDEVVFSIGDRSTVDRISQHLTEACTLEVPTVVDVKYGKNWGEIPK